MWFASFWSGFCNDTNKASTEVAFWSQCPHFELKWLFLYMPPVAALHIWCWGTKHLGSWFQIWGLHILNTSWCLCNINYACCQIGSLQTDISFYQRANLKAACDWSCLWDFRETCVCVCACVCLSVWDKESHPNSGEGEVRKGPTKRIIHFVECVCVPGLCSMTSTLLSTFNPPSTIDLVPSDVPAALACTGRGREALLRHGSMTVSSC